MAARLESVKHGGDRSEQEANWRLEVTRKKAAQMLNVSERSVTRSKKVQKDGVPELVEAVDKGKVSPSAAADVAELPEDEQQEVSGCQLAATPVFGGIFANLAATRKRWAHLALAHLKHFPKWVSLKIDKARQIRLTGRI